MELMGPINQNDVPPMRKLLFALGRAAPFCSASESEIVLSGDRWAVLNFFRFSEEKSLISEFIYREETVHFLGVFRIQFSENDHVLLSPC